MPRGKSDTGAERAEDADPHRQGSAPLKATVLEMERLLCNACFQMFTAAEAPGVGADKYDTTAVAMIALLKYGTGVPFQPDGAAGDTTRDSITGRNPNGS